MEQSIQSKILWKKLIRQVEVLCIVVINIDGSGWVGRKHHWASLGIIILLLLLLWNIIIIILIFNANAKPTLHKTTCLKMLLGRLYMPAHAGKFLNSHHSCCHSPQPYSRLWGSLQIFLLVPLFNEISLSLLTNFFLQSWIEMKILQLLEHKSRIQYFFPRKLLCHLPSDWSTKQQEACRSCKLHNKPWLQNEFNAKMAASRESRILLQGFGMFCKRCCLQVHSGMCLQV